MHAVFALSAWLVASVKTRAALFDALPVAVTSKVVAPQVAVVLAAGTIVQSGSVSVTLSAAARAVVHVKPKVTAELSDPAVPTLTMGLLNVSCVAENVEARLMEGALPAAPAMAVPPTVPLIFVATGVALVVEVVAGNVRVQRLFAPSTPVV